MKYELDIKNLNDEIVIEGMRINESPTNFLVVDYGHLGEITLPDFSLLNSVDHVIGIYKDSMILPKEVSLKLVFANRFKKLIENDQIARNKLIDATIIVRTKDGRKRNV